MSKGPTDKDTPNGNVVQFPGTKPADSDEVGADFVVAETGLIPTGELLDPVEIEKDVRARDAFVASQDLVRAIDQKAPTTDLVDVVLKEVAEELAHLKYERKKNAREGKSTAQHNVSRIAALRQIADILQRRQENARQERLDRSSPQFKQIIHLWMELAYESMVTAGLNEGQIDTVFKTMQSNMKDWEKRLDEISG